MRAQARTALRASGRPQGWWKLAGPGGPTWGCPLDKGPVQPDSLQEWSGGPCPNPAGGPGTGPLTFWGLCFVKPRKAPRPTSLLQTCAFQEWPWEGGVRGTPPITDEAAQVRGGCGDRHMTARAIHHMATGNPPPSSGAGGSALVECSGGVTLTITIASPAPPHLGASGALRVPSASG